MLAGKPVICFGATWWAEAPGVTRYRPGLTLDEVLAGTPTRAAVERFAGILQARSHSGHVQRHFARADTDTPDEDNAPEAARAILDLLDGRTPHTFDPQEGHP